MLNLLNYIIEMTICSGIFFILYFILFRKDTFFSLQRIFILFSLFLALFIPLFDFSFIVRFAEINEIPETGINYLKPVIIISGINTPGLSEILSCFYLSVSFILFLNFIHSIFKLYSFTKKSEVKIIQNIKIILKNEIEVPFSFYKYIFIPKNLNQADMEMILLHEQSHINRKHYLDNTLIEILKLLFWINPFLWFYSKSIKTVHEYQADRDTIESGINLYNYLELILNSNFGISFLSLTSNFNVVKLKERIKMITEKRTAEWKLFKYTIILPVTAILIFSFSLTDNLFAIEKKVKKKTVEYQAIEEMPEYKGDLMQVMTDNIKYPEAAKKRGKEGTVFLKLTIGKDGKISSVKVEKGIDKLLDAEAVRVAKLLEDWQPVTKNGETVSSTVFLPVKFKLK